MKKRFVASKRHTVEVDFHPYLREIRRERKRAAQRGLRRRPGAPSRLLGFTLRGHRRVGRRNRRRRRGGRPAARAARVVWGPRAPGLRAPSAEAVARSPRLGSLGLGLARPPDEPERPKTGIFSTTSRKKIGQNPSSRQSSSDSPWLIVGQAAGPGESEPRPVGLLEAEVRLGRDQQGRLRPLPRPLVTALVEVVVDPGHRPALRVLVERPELPVGEPKRAAPSKVRWGSSGRPRMLRQVVVRFVLPAGRPDQLVVLGEPLQPLAGDAARCSATIPSTSSNRAVRARRLLEAEQGDDAVDVDGEDRPAHGAGSYQR